MIFIQNYCEHRKTKTNNFYLVTNLRTKERQLVLAESKRHALEDHYPAELMCVPYKGIWRRIDNKGTFKVKTMDFNQYQQLTSQTAIYPKERGVEYVLLGLGGEAGEIQNKYKKVIRDKKGVMDQETKNNLADELGDLMWYVSQAATELGFPLGEIARKNIDKLMARKEKGTLSGSGDKR